MSMKTDEIELASRLFVTRGADAKPKFETLASPAKIIYNCVLMVVKHTPMLELVPCFYPESFYNGEMEEGGLTSYKEDCEEWYQDLEEDCVIPDLSLNRGDLRIAPCARITENWVDTKLDDRWSYMRIPLSHVVILTPEDAIIHDSEAVSIYEFMTHKV